MSPVSKKLLLDAVLTRGWVFVPSTPRHRGALQALKKDGFIELVNNPTVKALGFRLVPPRIGQDNLDQPLAT